MLCCHLVERESWCLFHSTPFCGHRRGVFKSKIKDSEFTTPWKRNYLLLKRKRSTVFSHLHVSVCKCDTLSDSYSTETVSLARLLDMFSLPSQPLGYLCPFCEAMTQMSLMSTWCSRLCPVRPFHVAHWVIALLVTHSTSSCDCNIILLTLPSTCTSC